MRTKSLDVLQHQLTSTLDSIIGKNQFNVPILRLAVAYSGGLDSSALLFLVSGYCRLRSLPLFAFHIHHGLSQNSDHWLEHCEKLCLEQNIELDFAKVTLVDVDKNGIEASARNARYRALGNLCQRHQVSLLLTAHHQDDQAETILLQLLRGSGLAGLSGMDASNIAPGLLGVASVLHARPLLDVSRQALAAYVGDNEIRFIEDESNSDTRYARNALRHDVMPILAKIAPGYGSRLCRSASHIQSAGRMLDELAQSDMLAGQSGLGLSIDYMQTLSTDRVNNLLRHWLFKQGVRMPSTARLEEIRKQLFEADDDAMVTIHHEEISIHRYGRLAYIETTPIPESTSLGVTWNGEPRIDLPQFFGVLYLKFSPYGIPRRLLIGESLVVHMRQGGEKLKLGDNRPTRSMKSHYQTLKIPYSKRLRLPYVSLNQTLLFAAGVGMDCALCEEGDDNVVFFWEPYAGPYGDDANQRQGSSQ